MKKHIKLLILIASLIIVFLIYCYFSANNNSINYIALGDSVAEGMTPYGNIGYSYADYINDYLVKDDRLNFYTKGFSKSGYTTENLKNDIENNRSIVVNEENISIKEALRESDLVTVSIGANDFIKGLSLSNFTSKLGNIKTAKKEIDNIGVNVKDLIILIKRYAKNKIILVGYYNPLPRLTMIKSEIDELIKYSNNVYDEICDDLDITCVDIFDIFDGESELLPNSLDIHPNVKGHKKIADRIIKKIE